MIYRNDKNINKIVLISGMFRSGTTLLWRILSADPEFEDYLCEPLHPSLKEEIDRFEHYKNYNSYPEIIASWSAFLYSQKFHLRKGEYFERLKKHFNNILKERFLVKTVRMTMRLEWLLNQFDNLFVINIIRDPRAVCYSYLKKSSEKGIINKLKNKVFSNRIDDFFDSRYLKWDFYLAKEYFDLLKKDSVWKNYLSKLDSEPPYIKILGLWRVNVEQSIKDIKGYKDRSLTVKHENVCKSPEKTIHTIYKKLNRKVPQSVLNNALGISTHKLGGHKKWQSKVSTKWLNRWNKIDDAIWKKGIKKAGLSDLIQKFGFRDLWLKVF